MQCNLPLPFPFPFPFPFHVLWTALRPASPPSYCSSVLTSLSRFTGDPGSSSKRVFLSFFFFLFLFLSSVSTTLNSHHGGCATMLHHPNVRSEAKAKPQMPIQSRDKNVDPERRCEQRRRSEAEMWVTDPKQRCKIEAKIHSPLSSTHFHYFGSFFFLVAGCCGYIYCGNLFLE